MGKITEPVVWARLCLKIAGLLETILPAALVTYTAYLKAKTKSLEATVALAEYEKRVAHKKLEMRDKHADKDPVDHINDVLDSAGSRKTNGDG